MRYEKCRECGVKWNVSKYASLPRGGYICPKCRNIKAPEAATSKGQTKIHKYMVNRKRRKVKE